MAGGTTNTQQNSTPTINFAPSSGNGGSIQIGGSIGMGNTEFGGSSTATGPSTSLDLKMDMGGMMGMGQLNLQNLVDMKNYEAWDGVTFSDQGKHTVENFVSRRGAPVVFSLQNLVVL